MERMREGVREVEGLRGRRRVSEEGRGIKKRERERRIERG